MALSDLVGRDDMWPAWQRTTDEHVALVVAGEMDYHTMRRERTKAFLADMGALLDDDVIATLEDRRLATMSSDWKPFADALPCLEWLRAAHVKVAAVTNGSGAHQYTKLADVGLEGYFDAVIIAGELGAAKPDPMIFNTACLNLGVRPEQTVHVGDRLEVDAIGARDAGMHGVWLDRAGTDDQAVPYGVHAIRSLAELPELLVSEFVTPRITVPAPRA
jgi:putative hydrolase of the HAD superfamily